MSRYRKLYPRLWTHPAMRALDTIDKALAVYILTSPNSNRVGFYRFSAATAAEDLALPAAEIVARLPHVLEAFEWYYDARAGVICIPSWLVWNAPENLNVLKGALSDLDDVPPSTLLPTFEQVAERLPADWRETFRQRLGNVSRWFGKRLPNQ